MVLAEKCKNQIFDSKIKPNISIEKYLYRIAKYSRISRETLVIALVYLDRLLESDSSLSMTSFNVHKYF